MEEAKSPHSETSIPGGSDTDSMPTLTDRSESIPASPGGQPFDLVIYDNLHILRWNTLPDMYQANDVGPFRLARLALGGRAPVEVEQPPLVAPPILERLLNCCRCAIM
jgi:hypothetical protein